MKQVSFADTVEDSYTSLKKATISSPFNTNHDHE